MKQINAFEGQLKMKLFERNNQGLQLTAAGKSLYKDAKHIINYSNKAIDKARSLVVDSEYTLCVASSLLNPCKPFMDLWYKVNHLFPKYKLHIAPFDDDGEGILSIIGTLGKKDDFVVGICDSDLWQERCSFLKLGEYKRGYAIPTTHPLASKESLTIQDLYGETLLMCKGGNAPVSEWEDIQLNHLHIKLVDTPHFYDMDMFNQSVQSGNILASAECWADIHPSLVTIPMAPESTVPFGLMYALDAPEDIVQIVEAIKEHIE